jgi:hypothetical protein
MLMVNLVERMILMTDQKVQKLFAKVEILLEELEEEVVLPE